MHRPSFAAMSAAANTIFPYPGGIPFDENREITVVNKQVADVIGGAVAKNIATLETKNDTSKWINTCAVRMSFILNNANVYIPKRSGQTVTGKDNRNYFYHVKDLILFLTGIWGKADYIIQFPVINDKNITGKNGLILFEVSGWSDASGHATLWNGTECYDHCYFNPFPNPKVVTKKAHFWTLK